MPTTSQLIERIKMQAPNWSTLGTRGVLSVISEVNGKMMNYDIDHAYYIDPATGFPPYLTTTATILKYDCPSNCRKVADVLVDASRFGQGYDDYGAYKQKVFQDKVFWSIPVTARRRVNDNALASVTFRSDPDTTTDKFYLLYFKQATAITGPNIQVDVPEEFHDLLLDGCVARIVPLQYGDENPWLSWIERLKTEFWSEINYNPPQVHRIARRFC